MSESKIEATGDALVALLKSSLAADGAHVFGHVVLYTSFGVVRGRTGISFLQPPPGQPDGAARQVLELNEVTVEHYSNHLPTASFAQFYVRLCDVQGFALLSL